MLFSFSHILGAWEADGVYWLGCQIPTCFSHSLLSLLFLSSRVPLLCSTLWESVFNCSLVSCSVFLAPCGNPQYLSALPRPGTTSTRSSMLYEPEHPTNAVISSSGDAPKVASGFFCRAVVSGSGPRLKSSVFARALSCLQPPRMVFSSELISPFGHLLHSVTFAPVWQLPRYRLHSYSPR